MIIFGCKFITWPHSSRGRCGRPQLNVKKGIINLIKGFNRLITTHLFINQFIYLQFTCVTPPPHCDSPALGRAVAATLARLGVSRGKRPDGEQMLI